MHCTTSIEWYIGKFVVNFFAIIFVYEGFLKEKKLECICKVAARELSRQNSVGEERRSRCLCKHWKRSIYPCGCKRQGVTNECMVSHPHSRRKDKSSKPKKSCCCGN